MNPKPVEQEAPDRVWITWGDAYPWDEPTEDATEYIRADRHAKVIEAALAADALIVELYRKDLIPSLMLRDAALNPNHGRETE